MARKRQPSLGFLEILAGRLRHLKSPIGCPSFPVPDSAVVAQTLKLVSGVFLAARPIKVSDAEETCFQVEPPPNPSVKGQPTVRPFRGETVRCEAIALTLTRTLTNRHRIKASYLDLTWASLDCFSICQWMVPHPPDSAPAGDVPSAIPHPSLNLQFRALGSL